MPIPDKKTHTIDCIESLPEGTRAELVDGIVYDLAAPSGTHQAILMNLATDIMNHIRRHHGDCMVFPAPYAVYLNNDAYTCLEPDIDELVFSSVFPEFRVKLRNRHEITCTSCLSIFPMSASENLVVARYDFGFLPCPRKNILRNLYILFRDSSLATIDF